MDYILQIVSNIGEALTNGLNNVYETAVDYADALSSTAQLICGIAAMLYIGSKLWKSWAKGESIDFYSMLRPFAIGLVIIFFSGFTKCLDALVAPVEAATEYVKESASNKVSNAYSEYFELQEQIRDIKAKAEAERAESEEKLSVWRTISKNIGDIKENLSNAGENIADAVFQFLVDLGSVVVDIFSMATVYFYKVYVLTAKIVLVLIGPFALALSVFPGFNGNFKAWVAQYINVSLYIPICNIIGFVQSMIVSECLYAPGTDSMKEIIGHAGDADVVMSISTSTTMIQICGMLLGIIAIMLYSHVPVFANWILRGDGSGGLAAAFSVGGGLAATKLGDSDAVNSIASKFGFKAGNEAPKASETQVVQ
ncbi:MAG: hypothetical protein MJ003_06220 [Paludibacteraceae bacterium]|nr:hypothetical protein [Paludibacteraceae bacterium]